MSSAAVVTITIGVILVLGALAFSSLARRSDVRSTGALSGETLRRDTAARIGRAHEMSPLGGTRSADAAEAEGAAARGAVLVRAAEVEPEIVPWKPPELEEVGVSRRHFFNVASVTLMGVGIGAFFASAFVAFLWPTGTGGFGGAVKVGKLGAVNEGIEAGGGFLYVPAARSWITAYPVEALPAAEAVYPENLLVAMRQGIVILSQKCPHLGCRVPECQTSQWFECPCHASQYNRAGEKKAGPAPRGMDRHPTTITANGDVVIDTGTVVTGPAIGINTTGQEAEGPHCIGSGDH